MKLKKVETWQAYDGLMALWMGDPGVCGYVKMNLPMY